MSHRLNSSLETALKDGEGQKNFYGGELTILSDKGCNKVPKMRVF